MTILRAFPSAKTLLAFVCRMNREPIRSPARSVANPEFHHTGDHVNEVARKVVAALERRGVRALNPAMGFPMEMTVSRSDQTDGAGAEKTQEIKAGPATPGTLPVASVPNWG